MNRLSAFPPLAAMASDFVHLAIAYVLALPIAWNREREAHSAGLRTFPIVAAACCGLAIVGAGMQGASSDSYSRILQGLLSGIGFIGGGAILRDGSTVRGTATAASVWCVGIMGAAVGLGMYHIAALLSLVTFITLRYLLPFKQEDRSLPAPAPGDTPQAGARSS